MTIQLVIAWFFTFFPITISPGPANLLLSSTSAQVGTRRTLPLMWGIVVVFAVQIAVIGIGIGQILFRYPELFTVFKILGALYLLYLALQFFRSSGLKKNCVGSKPSLRSTPRADSVSAAWAVNH